MILGEYVLCYNEETSWIDFMHSRAFGSGIAQCALRGAVGYARFFAEFQKNLEKMVKERTREIGIRKALGAPPRSILTSIIIESILITTAFGYLGMVIGVGLSELVNMIMQQSAAQSENGMSVFKDPTVDLSYVFVSTAILIIAGVIAGYMPARRAVKIKPIEAMREE